ncbi:MAG: ATP-binding protein [Bacteroidales bacterium]|jgi:NadR type nicotinamide-nucleotide adenylyltransferase|nr:ATP-binding protein [Bacteroidales bacterium]
MEKRIKKSIKRIVLIGAESTGKTELAESLSKHFFTVFVPEYAREYIEKLNADYTYNDVEHIAKKQIELENENYQKANKILFYDTYLIITKVWFKMVYNKIPNWINKKIEDNNIDLFLLCSNDIPWISDPVRENGGEMRDKLFEIYKKELNQYNCKFKIVTGTGEDRFNNALKLVNEFLDLK